MSYAIDESSSVATKKTLIKARGRKANNLTIDQTSFRRDKESLRKFSPNTDPSWEELTRETVSLDNGNAEAILMVKN